MCKENPLQSVLISDRCNEDVRCIEDPIHIYYIHILLPFLFVSHSNIFMSYLIRNFITFSCLQIWRIHQTGLCVMAVLQLYLMQYLMHPQYFMKSLVMMYFLELLSAKLAQTGYGFSFFPLFQQSIFAGYYLLTLVDISTFRVCTHVALSTYEKVHKCVYTCLQWHYKCRFPKGKGKSAAYHLSTHHCYHDNTTFILLMSQVPPYVHQWLLRLIFMI